VPKSHSSYRIRSGPLASPGAPGLEEAANPIDRGFADAPLRLFDKALDGRAIEAADPLRQIVVGPALLEPQLPQRQGFRYMLHGM
jgi:hypothetical protein